MNITFDNPNVSGTLAFVTKVIDDLRWNADGVALLMLDHGIRSRFALAKTLGLSRSVVNSAFNEHWEGHATSHMIAVMCSFFHVRMSTIVQEPVVQIRRSETERLHRTPHTRIAL